MTHLRDLQPGDRFILLRDGRKFHYIAIDRGAWGGWGGTAHIVMADGEDKPSTLHHACHVKRIAEVA